MMAMLQFNMHGCDWVAGVAYRALRRLAEIACT